MAADLGELLVPYMPTIRVPRTGDRVFKSECAFSFDSPVSVGAFHPGRGRVCFFWGGGRGLLRFGPRSARESVCVRVCASVHRLLPFEPDRK